MFSRIPNSRHRRDQQATIKEMEDNKMTESERLNEEWYEFKYWRNTSGFDPVRLVESRDESPSWEMHRAHIFEMSSGNFCLVTESGCSCYTSSEANLDFYPDIYSATLAFERFFK